MASFVSARMALRGASFVARTFIARPEGGLLKSVGGFAGRSHFSGVSCLFGRYAGSLLKEITSKSTCFATQRRMVQTKSDTEMSDFLKEEIQAEKESLKATGKAVLVKGFDVETNEAEVILRRNFENEKIKILVNVNHAVDAEAEADPEAPPGPEGGPQGMTKMVCKPNFSVEVQKGDYRLTFNCAIARGDDMEEEMMQGQEGEQYQDLFNIEEFAIHKGDTMKDSVYVMSGEVMDGSFYDNLMNMLDERGINSEFVQQLTDFCTLYEQKLYVNLLEHLQDIVKSK
ncbi:hypothetical protein RvY_12010 [Ramazzottius varieornatus]|uniref:Complement component 1 Q subcomponent-binding protein, mitochondrial n=1 Tax=Ramazzottius varieornatus TaxID=947166 RepID=A0A1D1VMB3_RAMVA|nr:hypothetical protein RvY_12010 [Ramazzottius varieornatus]